MNYLDDFVCDITCEDYYLDGRWADDFPDYEEQYDRGYFQY